MIAGVGPILGEGRAGYFIDPVGAVSLWQYRDGASWEGRHLAQRVDITLRFCGANCRKVAGRRSTLAPRAPGEAVVIAFRGRPDAVFVRDRHHRQVHCE